MSHVLYSQVFRVDSRLLVVGSQNWQTPGNSTPDPSFGHNLCFWCPNEQCEPILDIYASRAFYWYKERHNPLRFDPCNRFLKFRESTGTPSPKVGVCLGSVRVHSLTLSNTLSHSREYVMWLPGLLLPWLPGLLLPWLPGLLLPWLPGILLA
jgi:hypothetical protein